jgi:ribose/xylose/arabinose/galactoside ABC-type transport system permease subunit
VNVELGRRVAVHAARRYGIYIALALLVAYFSLVSEEFRTTDNLFLVLRQVTVVGILSIGMTFVILTAGIDLSVGSTLAVAGLVSAIYAHESASFGNGALAILLPFVIGIIAGAINGAVISYGRVSALIVTLGTLTAYRGFAVWYRVNPVFDLQSYYLQIGQASLGPVPVPVLIFAAVAVAASLVLNRTRFGRHVYAVGGNEEAARSAGIQVARVKLAVYVISGLCAGLAGLVYTSRLGAAESISGQGYELQAIAAVVVGGTSLFGGRGRISNTIVGTLLIGVLFNGLVLLNVSSPVQQMIIGAIIVAAVFLDRVLQSRAGT